MPGRDGYAVLEELRADERLSAIPVVVVSVDAKEAERVDCGAHAYIAKPVESQKLIDTIHTVLMHGVENVLVVDGEVTSQMAISTALREYGLKVSVATNGEQALAMLPDCQPQAIVLDLRVSIVDGPRVLAALKADPGWNRIPVVSIAGSRPDATELRLLAEDSSALVAKGHIEAAVVVDEILGAIAATAMEGGV